MLLSLNGYIFKYKIQAVSLWKLLTLKERSSHIDTEKDLHFSTGSTSFSSITCLYYYTSTVASLLSKLNSQIFIVNFWTIHLQNADLPVSDTEVPLNKMQPIFCNTLTCE